MTYREDFTFPAEMLEQVAEQGLDVLPELIRIVINALVGFAPHLIGEEKARFVKEALNVALTIDREDSRSESLATLAPYLWAHNCK